jgi:hypothetical protein
VATSSVFIVMAIAAHEGRKTAVVDVGGAFLNARMSGTVPVHMRLDKTMTDFVIGLDKRYSVALYCTYRTYCSLILYIPYVHTV